MTNLQKIRLRLSKVRQRLNEIAGLEGDDFTPEIRSESATLQTEYSDLETRQRAAIVGEGEGSPEVREIPGDLDAEARERLELRSRASVGAYLLARLKGRAVEGAEAELAAAAGVSDGGIPLEAWDVAQSVPGTESAIREAREVTAAPGTVGTNLQPIMPAIFAPSIAGRLGIEMPRVASGTYASATITGSQSASAHAKGSDAVAVAGSFTVTSATPKRVSARLELAIEDVAAAGVGNFESALRENLSLALSDALDGQMLNGDGNAPNLAGIFQRLTDPDAPGAAVASFDDFVAAFAGGIDGLWSSRMGEVAIVAGPDSYRLAARTFRDAAGADLGGVAFSDYAAEKFGGFWTNKRMPDAAANVQQAILYRSGRAGIRRAVCPHWGQLEIDDIFSGAASGQRSFTAHILLGDVILTQPGAYAQVAFRVAV